MKTLLISVFMLFVLTLPVFGAGVSASPTVPSTDKDTKLDDITGYGDFLLRGPIPDLEYAAGPILDNSSTPDMQIYTYVMYEPFNSGGQTATATVAVLTLDSNVFSTIVEFDNLILEASDIDDIVVFVRSLRTSLVDKYSRDLILGNYFNFGDDYSNYESVYTGYLGLQDDEGDAILMSWDGYELSLIYTTAEAWEMANAINENATEQTRERI